MPLNSTEFEIVVQNLTEDEGYRQFPYMDCCGKLWKDCLCQFKGNLTLGIGRNVDKIGVSQQEASYLLINNINETVSSLEKVFPWFRSLTSARKVALVNMTFNLGIAGIMKFKGMIGCLEVSDFAGASKEMLNSQWSKQVGERATKLAVLIKVGQF